MKSGNEVKRSKPKKPHRHGIRQVITLSAVTAALGLWGTFAQVQVQQTTEQYGANIVSAPVTTERNGFQPVPTLVPTLEASGRINQPAMNRSRRPAPITTTRSSR